MMQYMLLIQINHFSACISSFTFNDKISLFHASQWLFVSPYYYFFFGKYEFNKTYYYKIADSQGNV